jgi:hypothetical protein
VLGEQRRSHEKITCEYSFSVNFAQRLVDQSTSLLDSEHAHSIERGMLLLLQALRRVDHSAVDPSRDGEASQARLAADQHLRRALALSYTHTVSPISQLTGGTFEDRGWTSWSSEAIGFSPDGGTLTAASAWDSPTRP